MQTIYKVKAVNDERDFCECCGKTGLKRVVWIENTETSEIKHFGTTCAMSPVKGFGIDPEIKQAVRRAQDTEKRRMQYAHGMYRKQGGKYHQITADYRDGLEISDRELFTKCQESAKKDIP